MQPLGGFASDIVRGIIRRAPLSPEKVAFAWRSAAGPAMARVASVDLSSDGIVEVRCPDDHWRKEIRRSSSMLRDRLRVLLGDEVVRQVKVKARSREQN